MKGSGYRPLFRWLLVAVVVLIAVPGQVGAQAASSDYTQSVTALNAAQAQISFTPTTPAALVDVHYLTSGANQQNFRMADNGGTWQQTVSGLSSGTLLEYWFTYEKGGPLFDTPHFTYTQAGGSGGSGTFPVTFQNNTRGTWSNAQIYVLVLGQAVPGQWSLGCPEASGQSIH
jgi:hypothetical protein